MDEAQLAAIVGAGVIAQEHIGALKSLDFMRLVAACDNDEQKAVRTSEEWGIEHHYANFYQMVGNKDAWEPHQTRCH